MDRIKESFDSLPIAACFFDKNGVVRLINRRMLAIANWLQKGGIQSLAEMQSALQAPPANVRCLDPRLRIYRFPDGRQLRFAQEQITTKAGVRYTQITAADVTELIRKQNQLKAENAKLAEANERFSGCLRRCRRSSGRKRLAMKLRVHDDIGHSILFGTPRAAPAHGPEGNSCKRGAVGTVNFSALSLQPDNGAIRTAGGGKKRAEELGVRFC